MKKPLLATTFIVCAFLAIISPSRAVVLDWDSVTWSPQGSLTQSFDVDPSFVGNDVRVNFSGFTGQLYTDSPRVGTDLTGGFVPVQNALIINTNHVVTSTYVTITIDFLNPLGAINPTFSLYDIDVGAASGAQFTWQDQISNIQASFGAITYTPTFSNLGSAVTSPTSNSLLGNVNVNETSGAGNATISFTGTVSRIQFTYAPGPSSIANPDGQVIALSDITFNSISGVPEVNTVWVAFAALFMAVVFQGFRRRKSVGLEFSPVS